jgi:hypothetical protein
MLLSLGNSESRRAYALISALDSQEITLDEFVDAIKPLAPETIQVTATVLQNHADLNGICRQRLSTARLMCSRLAAASRVLS